MERHFTARFYKIARLNDEPTMLADAIAAIEAIPLAERRYDARAGLPLRLEAVRRRRGLILCDMSRIQSDDKPGNFTSEGIEPLDADELSHAFSFLFDPQSDTITLMHDERARLGALLDYLCAAGNIAPLGHHAIASRATLERLDGQRVKSLRIKMARNDRAPDLFNGKTDVERELRSLAALMEAPFVEVNFTIGRGEREPLSFAGVRNAIVGLLEGSAPVEELQVGIQGQDEVLDFLDQVLKYRETVNLPAADQHNAAVCDERLSFIERAFEHHRDDIRSRFKAAGAV